MEVSVVVAVDWTVTVESGVAVGMVATGLRKIVVVPVVREAPTLGETPLSQPVVPETTE